MGCRVTVFPSNHNGGPPLAVRNFKRRWAEAIFAHPEKPAGAVAMAFRLYMAMDSQGRGAAVADLEFVLACGVSERSVRYFKQWLVEQGFVHINVRGARGRSTEFAAFIPSELPATDAANQAQLPAPAAGSPAEIPATITGKNEKYRQPLPLIETEIPATIAAIPQLPATIAGNSQLPAPVAGIPSGPSRAHIESPSEILINEVKSESARTRDVPHMNGVGFVISEKQGLAVPSKFVAEWRERFPAIPDLDAAMTRLGTWLLTSPHSHPGRQCPEGWMVGPLAEENQKNIDRARVTDAKIRRAHGEKPHINAAEKQQKLSELDQALEASREVDRRIARR